MAGKKSGAEIREFAEEYDGWAREDGQLVKTFEFEDFAGALEFVNQVGEIAEGLGHHPDITLQNYNEVVLQTKTHEANAVTEKDFRLVEKIEESLGV